MIAHVSACSNSVTLSLTLTRTDVPVKVYALVKYALFWPVRVAKARHHAAILSRLDDRELRDIGLTRQDVLNTTALAMDEDPSRHLAKIARERRESGIRL